MAQTKKCKQMHTEQVAAAQEMFESYKKFIVEEFIAKYGRSYERPDNLPTRWQDYYEYSPMAEEFLIDKTKTFIHVAPDIDRKHQSPVFLKNLIGLICEYLSLYTVKKGWDRNTCTKYLRTILFDKNQHVQLEMQRYVKENERAWGQQQKEKREQTQQKKEKRKRARGKNAQPVHMSKREKTRLESKSVNRRLDEKRKELGIRIEPVVYSDEQEARYNKKKAESHARKLLEKKQILTIQIAINGIVK